MSKLQGYSRKHPKAGQQLTVKSGKLEGRTVLVIDYLTSQYAGKDIKKIKANSLTTAVINRGFPLDSDYVFVQFYPTMEYGCVHDSELKVKLKEAEPAKAEAAPVVPPTNVKSIRSGKKKKDATESNKGE